MAKSPEKTKNVTYCSVRPNAKNGKFADMTGSHYDEFSHVVMSQALCTRWTANSDDEAKNLQTQAVFGTMLGLKPRDETEGMLIAQMIGCHNAAMECFRRAMIKEQTHEGRQQNLNFANKLSRTYALHMEALDKHRGKGQQTVRVEHVTVNAGGQAIVGNVESRARVRQRSEDQAHAESITHAPEPEMRSSFEAEREAVPERRDEER
jgi:hypothetical protein